MEVEKTGHFCRISYLLGKIVDMDTVLYTPKLPVDSTTTPCNYSLKPRKLDQKFGKDSQHPMWAWFHTRQSWQSKANSTAQHYLYTATLFRFWGEGGIFSQCCFSKSQWTSRAQIYLTWHLTWKGRRQAHHLQSILAASCLCNFWTKQAHSTHQDSNTPYFVHFYIINWTNAFICLSTLKLKCLDFVQFLT